MDEAHLENVKLVESSPLLAKTSSLEHGEFSARKLRPKTFDEALESSGVGLFHCVLILVAGWALASDSVEVQCVSFVTPLLNDVERNPDTKLAPTKVKRQRVNTCQSGSSSSFNS